MRRTPNFARAGGVEVDATALSAAHAGEARAAGIHQDTWTRLGRNADDIAEGFAALSAPITEGLRAAHRVAGLAHMESVLKGRG